MIYVITGPTCSGKSKIAFSLAKKLHGEIINCDVFQMYKELNIGTAKPSMSERREIRHHLFDVISPNEFCSVADYQKMARKIIDDLLKKNIPVIIVGGGGLYLRAVLYDYEFGEEKEPDMTKFNLMSNDELYLYLKKVDPKEAQKLHPNNRQRVLRDIKIYLNSGISKTELLSKQNKSMIYQVNIFGVEINRDVLYDNINKRVDQMIKDGFVDEVKKLLSKYDQTCPAFRAIGYKEIIDYLNGRDTLVNTVEKIKKHTRNYAKTQLTFFRHQFSTLQWIHDEKDINL